MGWVGHDLKTGEVICLGRWHVDFNFWVGLRWLGASQMYVVWCVLRWSGLDSVLFGLGHLLSWVRIGIRPLENWLGILHEVGLSEPGQFFKSSIWPTQQINQQHILISLSISISLSLSLSLNLQELTFTVEIPEISPSSLMILDTSWRKVSKYL